MNSTNFVIMSDTYSTKEIQQFMYVPAVIHISALATFTEIIQS